MRFVALALVVVAALFSGVVVGVMAATWLTEQATTPPDPTTGEPVPPETATLRTLRARLQDAQGAEAEALKAALRQEDQRVRTLYRTRRRRLAWGAWLLLVGLGGLVAAARWYASLDPRRPMPRPLAERPDAEGWLRARRRNLVAVGLVAGLLALSFVVMGLSGGRTLPRPEAGEETEPPAVAVTEVDRAGFQDDWPRFRGPHGLGIVQGDAWPTDWDGASGRNVVWRSEVPAFGKSSPVVWGNRIFLTGARGDTLQVMGFERKTGKLLWTTPVPSPLLEPQGKVQDGEEPFRVFEDTGYAAATPATDGRRLYVVFATADVAALDFQGRLLWHRHLGRPENMYGMSSSLAVYRDRAILQHDQGGDATEGLSALIAFDGATGKTAWRTPRPVPNSWTSPIIVNTGERTEIITSANDWVIGYDPETGRELWRAQGVTGDVAPSPIFAGGLVFVTTQYSRVVAIRAGGTGNVTATHTAWVAEDGMSDAPTPLSDGSLFLQVHSSGWVTCYDAHETDPPEEGMKWPKGRLVWETELKDVFWSSPVLVGGLVHLTSKGGKTHLFPLARRFQLRGTNELGGGEVFATPAFGDGQIYFRTTKELVCIGQAPATEPSAPPKKPEPELKQPPQPKAPEPKAKEPPEPKAPAKDAEKSHD